MRKILCVDADDAYRTLLMDELIEHGYNVDGTNSSIKGLEMIAKNKYDLVISALKLPIMTGVMFTESVKNVDPEILCIILTGDPDEESELESIKNNVDLYIEKNKSLPIILGYISKFLDENSEEMDASSMLISEAEQIELNIKEHSVKKDGEYVDLTPKEFEILHMFLSHKNEVISREEFLDEVWQEPSFEIDLRLVDSHIKKLRDKIKAFSIITVRGYGYKWNEVE